jgi:hypothetical protein
MRPFDPLLAMLGEVPDPRRAEGKLYKLPYILLFSILAVVTGGNSFRSIETFIKVHRRRLNAAFGLRWKRAPAHTAIRYILQGLDPQAVEQVFRRHAAGLLDTAIDTSRRTISLDGKTLKQSFDNFNDRKAAQVLHAFNLEAGLVLAHVEIDEKSNEIPAAQRLLGELQLANCTVTLDAMHCQKNHRGRRSGAGAHHRPTERQSADPVAASRSTLCLPPSRKQRYFGHQGPQSAGNPHGRRIQYRPCHG